MSKQGETWGKFVLDWQQSESKIKDGSELTDKLTNGSQKEKRVDKPIHREKQSHMMTALVAYRWAGAVMQVILTIRP